MSSQNNGGIALARAVLRPIAFAALAAAAVAPSAVAADIYVSPTGVDAPRGRGSITAPYRTLPYVLSPANGLVQAGDRLILRGPTGNNIYRQDEVRIRVPLTIQSFDGEWAVIECPITVEDGVCVQIDPGASGTTLRRIEVKGGAIYTVFLQTSFDQRDNPRGFGARNVTLEDCRLHGSGRDVVKITPKSDDTTIRRCEIFNSGQIYPPGTPLDDKNAEGIDNVNGSNMVVEDSYIHDIATSGIYWKGGAADARVERNRVERTGLGGILIGFDTSPEFFDLTANPGYYEAVRGVVQNNLVRDTGFAGIGLFASRDARVANNTIINSATQGHAGIYFGVTLQDYEPLARRPANTGASIVNNIIVQSGGDCGGIRFANELGGLSGLAGPSGMDSNYFHNTRGTCNFVDRRDESSAAYNGVGLVGWRVASAGDARSLEGASPLNPQGRLVATGAGAALVGSGVGVEGLTIDISRKPRSTRPDWGANQASSTQDCGLWNLAADCDGDGIPNIAEQIFGLNPDRRDNDIFLNSLASRRLFVMQQYRDFLSREGDIGGIDFWVAEMAANRATPSEMAQNYVLSQEFQGRVAPVSRAYFTVLGRYATLAELNAGVADVAATGSAARTISNLVASAELANRYGNLDNAAFVARLYTNALGRSPDAFGASLVADLTSGARSRAQVASVVAESSEAAAHLSNRVYVAMMYAGMLRREPDQGGFDFWVGEMNRGRSGLDLVSLFIGSPEYRGRFLE